MYKLIAIVIGGRSDRGLTLPIIKRLNESPNFETIVLDMRLTYLSTTNFQKSFLKVSDWLRTKIPDLMLCVGDRVEMTAAAAYVFHRNIPIAHVYAGAISGDVTFDARNRHVISLWSDIQFCESEIAKSRIENLFSSVNLKSNAHVVGCTHMDDLEINESDVAPCDYDLILYNPLTTVSIEETKKDLKQISQVANKDKLNIWISPNADINVDIISKYIQNNQWITPCLDNLPRPEFLGLLKNCDMVIGNSSAMYYEVPFFHKKTVYIGERNESREIVTEYGASDKIVKILEKFVATRVI